jgi:ribosome biogenesis protein MAK21
MPSKPDLGMHTLTHFLDRFVYRNAKTVPSQGHGSSIMQPLAGGDTRGMVLSTRGTGKSAVPVNSDAFWKQRIEDVAVDEVFFHKYFNNVAPKKGSPAEKAKKDAEDSEVEEQNEVEIWKALVGSRPELEGDDPDAGDVDFDDEDEGDSMDVDDEEEGSDEGPTFGDDGDDAWSDEDDVPDDVQKAFEAELEVASEKKAKEAEVAKEDDADSRKKRRKLKNLPTFANADDYASMLSD